MAKQIIKVMEKDQRFWIIELLESLKKRYKKKSRYQVWEEDNHPKLIQGLDMLNQKIDYIHQNPVKRGLVRKAEDWKYSSASNYLGLDSDFEIDMLEVF